MRWKWEAAKAGTRVAIESERPEREGVASRHARIRTDLESRGIASEHCDALSRRIEARLAAVGPDAYGSLLEGVAVAYGVQGEAGEQVDQSLRELQEIERLMGAFAGELSKLDEVLEVLAAYVRRMRTNSPVRDERLFH